MSVPVIVTVLAILMVSVTPSNVSASPGFAEWDQTVCDDIVLSNSNSYDAIGLTPFILLGRGENDEVIVDDVYEAECLDHYVVGRFWHRDTAT